MKVNEVIKEEKYSIATLRQLVKKAEAMVDKDYSQYTPADHAFMDKFFGYHLPNMLNQFGDLAGIAMPILNSMYEKSPPGREKQVKKLKKKFDDPGAPYAIAWAQHNKHGKPKKK